MSEWLKEHAWKSDSFTHSDAQQHPPTQFPSMTSRNNNAHPSVLLNDDNDPRLWGVCDTVLTQKPIPLPATHIEAYRLIWRSTPSPRLALLTLPWLMLPARLRRRLVYDSWRRQRRGQGRVRGDVARRHRQRGRAHLAPARAEPA